MSAARLPATDYRQLLAAMPDYPQTWGLVDLIRAGNLTRANAKQLVSRSARRGDLETVQRGNRHHLAVYRKVQAAQPTHTRPAATGNAFELARALYAPCSN
jgi:hypothetical protein